MGLIGSSALPVNDERTGGSPVPLSLLHRAEDLQAEAFVGTQDAAVGFEFVQGSHGHAKIDGGKWPAANDAFFPALRFGDFFNFLR